MPMSLLHSPRPEQLRAITLAQSLQPGQRLLLTAPTGSGKGSVLAALLIDGWTVACPNLDICDAVARHASVETEGTEAARRKRYESLGLYTYKRLHSRLSDDMVPPAKLACDEAHHGTADTLTETVALARNPTLVGVTATAYRGTPQETEALHAMYHGNVVTVVTLKDCIAKGYTTLPSFDVWPLIDDELISVTGGEFSVRASESAAVEQMPALVARIVETYYDWQYEGSWKQPITLVLPSVEACEQYAQTFRTALGQPGAVETVVADTKGRADRYKRVLARNALLLQVRAVGEGTDIALRVMIDAAPTMSPVLWMQRVGRLTRPGGVSQYIATNHNLMRHAYLFEGLIPPAQLRKTLTAWPNFTPSRRTMCRALGLTGFGRFEPCAVPLADGTDAFMYALRSKTGEDELAALLIPGAPEPLYFHRRSRIVGTERKEVKPGVIVDARVWDRGKWARVKKLPELEKCASMPPHPLTPKQIEWWVKSAPGRGLASSPDSVTARNFAILPILFDAGMKVVTASS